MEFPRLKDDLKRKINQISESYKIIITRNLNRSLSRPNKTLKWEEKKHESFLRSIKTSVKAENCFLRIPFGEFDYAKKFNFSSKRVHMWIGRV